MEDEGSVVSANSDLDLWEKLLAEQTALFRKTSSRNEELEYRLEELERELQVWKVAYKTAEEDKFALTRKVAKLERSLGALKDDNPLAICLIDGDGNIFSSELLTQGHAGGRRAAQLLTQGINAHMTKPLSPQPERDRFGDRDRDDASDSRDGVQSRLGSADSPTPTPTPAVGRTQLWLTVYCNKRGLAETLANTGVCTTEQFDEFVQGFNQASPLFSFVDVGSGKEAADAKIKECLRVFTRFPQTTRVFFGGAHDNGYTSTLNFLHNEGLIDKLVILRGYSDLASEVRSLNLPHLDIEGVFMTKKLQTYAHARDRERDGHKGAHRNGRSLSPVPPRDRDRGQSALGNGHGAHHSHSHGYPPVRPQDFEKFRTRANTAAAKYTNTAASVTDAQGFRKLVPGVPLHMQRPPPCNFFYLGTCESGEKCRFAHDYILLTEHVEELRVNAKKWPCPYANRSKACPYGRECPMAHACPKGAKCSFARSGRCKFVARGMHDSASIDWTPSKRYESPDLRTGPERSSYSPGRMSPAQSPNLNLAGVEPLEASFSPMTIKAHTLLNRLQ